MKRLLSMAVVILLMAVGVCAQDKPKLKTVAVTEFLSTGGLSKTETGTLSNRFRGMLVQTAAFQVIEREQMNAILKEQDFTLTDNCNSAECAVQVGQMLGVEQMISGDIGKLGTTWTVDLRLIDITTGKIIQTQTGNYKGAIDGLLDIMSDIAYKFAGIKNPNPPSIQYGEKSNKTLWYVIGGVAVVGSGAAFLLGGGASGKKGSPVTIGIPAWPNE